MVEHINNSHTHFAGSNQYGNNLNTSKGIPKFKLTINPLIFVKNNTKTKEEIIYKNRVLAIKSIIEEDPSAPEYVNSTKLANMIMQTGKETGMDPLVIACICKKETHFDQKKLNVNGKGIMQITSIVTEDMYQRTQLYEPKMKGLIEKYGSLEKVFQAKKKNSSINLGNFGEMLYKYKTPEKLYEALQKNTSLNLKCGAYLLKFKLSANNGDLKKALEDYNATVNKHNYSKAVLSYINNSKSILRLNAYI